MSTTSPKKPTAIPPKPGEPRPCKTDICRTMITPGKDGARNGYCRRCNHYLDQNKPVPPRARQPKGQKKKRIPVDVPPAMFDFITPEMLAAFKVKSRGDFLRLAGARLLGRADFEPVKVQKPEGAS